MPTIVKMWSPHKRKQHKIEIIHDACYRDLTETETKANI